MHAIGQVLTSGISLQTVNSQFQALDGKITSVGRTAVRIGASLSPARHSSTALLERA